MAYLVRSFQTNARIRSLTTGTFNRVVKDRIAIRLSGANSVQANPHKCESDCPRNLTNIRAAQDPVNASDPQNFHVISTMGIRGGGQESGTFLGFRLSLFGFRFSASAGSGSLERATVWPSASQIIDLKAYLGHAKAEDRKLRKELTFGGPCFEGTLQKPNWCFRIKSRGRDDLRILALYCIRCRTRTRVAEKRPASHTNALGELFIADK